MDNGCTFVVTKTKDMIQINNTLDRFTAEQVSKFESVITREFEKGNFKVILPNQFLKPEMIDFVSYMNSHYPSCYSKNPYRNIYLIANKKGQKITPVFNANSFN